MRAISTAICPLSISVKHAPLLLLYLIGNQRELADERVLRGHFED